MFFIVIQGLLFKHFFKEEEEGIIADSRRAECGQTSDKIKAKNLPKHQSPVVHKRKKTHKCSICNNKFTLMGSLTIHMRTHTGERPYECTICHKKFIQSAHLSNHTTRKHKEDKAHKCNICAKRFTCAGEVKVHMRIHTGERPYVCKICHRRFIQSAHLNKHMFNLYEEIQSIKSSEDAYAKTFWG